MAKISYQKYSEIRNEKNLTDKDVARGSGVNPGTISLWKNGKTTIGTNSILAISEFLNVAVDEFVDRSM